MARDRNGIRTETVGPKCCVPVQPDTKILQCYMKTAFFEQVSNYILKTKQKLQILNKISMHRKFNAQT